LWKDKLNPETSSYISVLRAAEINEIAETIANDAMNEGNHAHGTTSERHKKKRAHKRENLSDESSQQNNAISIQGRFRGRGHGRWMNQTLSWYTNEIPRFNSNRK
jgi:hypothetical protein